MVTIAASRVWALNTLRRLLWMSNAPIAGGWPSRGGGPGFASCKGAGYPCLCRDLGFPLVATGGRLLPAVAGLVLQWQWGILLQKQRGLLLLPALRYQWSCLGNGPASPMEGGYRLYPLALPPAIGCRSLHRSVSQTNPEMMVQYRCHPPGGHCLEWLALPVLPRVAGSTPGLEPSQACTGPDSTATVAYINRQGGLRSRRMSQLARHLLLWSRKHLRSLRAIHIPGLLNQTADELSRAALPGEWRLHPQTVQLIWRRFGLAQVDLFASLETSHCQLFYSLTEGTLGTDALAHSWPRGLRKYEFPPVSLLAQTLCKVREEEEQVLLVAPYWPTRTWFPELMLLVTAPPWQIPLRKDLLTQRRGTLWHPRPDLWKLHVWSLDGTRRF